MDGAVGLSFIVPETWNENLPRYGIFTTTYICDGPFVLEKDRRRLAVQYLGWPQEWRECDGIPTRTKIANEEHRRKELLRSQKLRAQTEVPFMTKKSTDSFEKR